MEHKIVCSENGRFCAWPANNGVWSWDGGKEILVGFTQGDFEEKKGHNICEPYISLLARSKDGGHTWKTEKPENFVGNHGSLMDPPGGVPFHHPDFAMRVEGTAYHASDDPRASFFYSSDRGVSWKGPHHFGDIPDHREVAPLNLTPRTDYIVEGPDSCLIIMSGKNPDSGMRDRTFCVRTPDGGKSFQFVSWLVSFQDPHRAVMASTVKTGDKSLLSALRRRESDTQNCWIDVYASKDGGLTWSFLSKVDDTGGRNGNPPALIQLHDGRLCCVYGNRDADEMRAKYSRDDGVSWSGPVVIRNDLKRDSFGDADFGYPRLVQNHEGNLVAMYYWATKENFHNHIAATIWDPSL